MKQKLSISLTALTLAAFLSLIAGSGVQAAELPYPVEVDTAVPASEVTQFFYGTSYDQKINDLTCECDWIRMSDDAHQWDRVHAMTSYGSGASVVTIYSVAYDQSNGMLGSGGNAANATTSTTYDATTIVHYTYQKHEAPEQGRTVHAYLYRF